MAKKAPDHIRKHHQRHLTKVAAQKINTQENKAYYQNASEWKSPSSPRAMIDRRTPTK